MFWKKFITWITGKSMSLRTWPWSRFGLATLKRRPRKFRFFFPDTEISWLIHCKNKIFRKKFFTEITGKSTSLRTWQWLRFGRATPKMSARKFRFFFPDPEISWLIHCKNKIFSKKFFYGNYRQFNVFKNLAVVQIRTRYAQDERANIPIFFPRPGNQLTDPL